ncbi:transketolase [Candidatus Gottesmanbacteria bacterium]|nr:transketolase [Candidatus Gottesmanbacteria bacterium]
MEKSALENLARLIRYYILISTTAAGSGHPTTSLSATDLMTVLFFKYLRADLNDPQNPTNDRVIFSKGHASPLLYALYAAAGKVTEKELLKLRTFDSPLEGHPVPRFRFTEAATGSLGQGLAVGVGEALALSLSLRGASLRATRQSHVHNANKQEIASPSERSRNDIKVFVLLGDGELAEGSVWEAAALASYYRLNHLIAIADINGLGQSQETMYNRDIDVYAKRFAAFGWRVITLEDGHDLSAIDATYKKVFTRSPATVKSRFNLDFAPVAILAKTIKGKGVSFLEGKHGWHGKALTVEELAEAFKELGEIDQHVEFLRAEVARPNSEVFQSIRSPSARLAPSVKNLNLSELPALQAYDKPTATRRAFGNALVRIGKTDPLMVILDADVQNSTYTEFFAKAYPNLFFQMFIAEQTMVSAAVGMAKRGLHPWLATFACFLTRAFDQVRMAALSRADIKICGSHAGVSIGQDGGSQMGLEDIAMFRAVHGSTVLYPSDAISTEKLVEQMAQTNGIVYMRTTRGETPVIYDAKETFAIGGSKTHPSVIPGLPARRNGGTRNPSLSKTGSRLPVSGYGAGSGRDDKITVVAAGITLHEALKAQKQLAGEDISVRVIDCYSVKPIDVGMLRQAAKETKAIIIVEDHYPEGGLGEAVTSALKTQAQGRALSVKLIHLAVRKTPRSAKPAELLAYEEIDSGSITKAVRQLIK